MVDQQPGDTTPAAGMPDPTRFAGTDGAEPPTAAVPGRWSGAAMVPEPSPRRSRWSRILDRFTGSADSEHDDRTAVPAVDPWADQDTPVWAEAYSTSPAGLAPTPASPPTRLDNPTTVDDPARRDSPASATRVEPPTRTEPSSAAPPSAAPAAAGAAPGETPAGAIPARRPVDRNAGRSGIPAPGTLTPSSAGSGLPPKLREWGERAATEAPEKLRTWSRQAAAKSQEVAATAPGKLRSWRQKAATIAPRRQPAARPAPPPAARGPVQPHIPLGRPRPPVTPPWAGPPAPPRPRRRMRKLRRLVLLLVVLAALVTGRPYIQEHVPGLNQYPVTAVLPDSFADLSLRDTAAGEKAARRLAEQLQEAGADGEGFAGLYTDARGKRVTVFGVTGLRLTPASDLDGQLSRLSESLGLKDVQTYDAGEFGLYQRCGTGRLDGTSVVACGWADHGSLATVLLTRRSLDDSADLFLRLRESVLAPA